MCPGPTLPNTAFSTSEPAMQLAWDATSMSALKECPRKYQLSIVLGWAPRGESVDLSFGVAYHAALECYHRQRALGLSHADAQRNAIRKALGDTWNFDLGAPIVWDHPRKTRYTLIRTLVWYLDQFSDDPAETVILANGKPAVELSFRLRLEYKSALTSEPFLWCGHLDRVVQFQGETWTLDYKTTSSDLNDNYFNRYTPDNQVSGYAFAGRIVHAQLLQGVIIDAARVMVGFSDFRRGIITRTQEQLEEWLRDLEFYLYQAAYFAKRNYWPMNDRACAMCKFRPICSGDPRTRQEWLESAYTRRVWDPLKIRGDV